MAGRAKDQPSIYQLKVTIRGIRPPVWRRLQVSGAATFGDLHDILQRALGWEDYHLHHFAIGDAFYGVPDPEDADWDFGTEDERRARLQQILGHDLKKFVYEYDFGDGWEHMITVEKVLTREPGVAYPRCLVGRRAGPPEDSGGPWGYARLIEVTGDPKHPEYEEMREWLGENFDPERFGLEDVNLLLCAGRRGCRRNPR